MKLDMCELVFTMPSSCCANGYMQRESKQHGIAPYIDSETRPEKIQRWKEWLASFASH